MKSGTADPMELSFPGGITVRIAGKIDAVTLQHSKSSK